MGALPHDVAVGQQLCNIRAGQVTPGGTEFVVWLSNTLAVDGYFKLLSVISEHSPVGLGSLAGTMLRK